MKETAPYCPSIGKERLGLLKAGLEQKGKRASHQRDRHPCLLPLIPNTFSFDLAFHITFAAPQASTISTMSDPTLYLYTSLTAGSSHIVTATARLETILKANKLPFRAIDVATDEVARKLWGRRSKGKKLPGLVKFGTVVGVRIFSPHRG